MNTDKKKYKLTRLQWAVWIFITIILVLVPLFLKYLNYNGYQDEFFRGEKIPIVLDMYSMVNALTLLALAITALGYKSSLLQTKASEEQVFLLSEEVKHSTETKPLEDMDHIIEKVSELMKHAQPGDKLYFVAATITIGYTGLSKPSMYKSYVTQLRATIESLGKFFFAI